MKQLKNFLILWITQALSQLGSAMTSFALTLWLYRKTGSALETALLSICSYAPYVVLSIFAGMIVYFIVLYVSKEDLCMKVMGMIRRRKANA